MSNFSKKTATRALAGALAVLPLVSAGCGSGGYYRYRRPSPRYIHYDYYGGLDARLGLQYQKLNGWYQHEIEKAGRRHFAPGEYDAFLYNLDCRYYNGLRQLERGRHIRTRDFYRRLERDRRQTFRRIERHRGHRRPHRF